MTLGKTTSNRPLPVDATTSKIYATPVPVPPSRKASLASQPPRSPTKERFGRARAERRESKGEEPPKENAAEAPPSVKVSQPDTNVAEMGKTEADKSGWLGWLAANNTTITKEPQDTSKPAQSPASETDVPPKAPTNTKESTPGQKTDLGPSAPTQPDVPPPGNSNKRTWLQMWGGDTTQKEGESEGSETPPTQATAKPDPTKSLDIPKPQTPSKSTSQASSIETSPPPALPGDPTKSSGWIFWSRDKKSNTAASAKGQPHLGEIAISDTPSQSRPKRASISLPKDEKPPEPKGLNLTDLSKGIISSKTGPAKPPEFDRPDTSQSATKGNTKKDPKVLKAESANAAATLKPPTEASTRTASPAPSAKIGENLLLPALSSTLRLPENPSILQQLARLLYYTREPEFKHLSLVRDPPRIRNALAIGVHGYFPGPMVRTLLGQPTGTSIKFADMAAKSIRKWTRSRGYDCQVKTAALEGEGKIAERVELLWKLLLNWIEEIRKSDFVMVACHSQGVPVAIMLLSKLIQFGCISAARVGICAMAGVNTGPFVEYKSRWISGSAGELFDFSNPDSKVSTDYIDALEVLLKAGVRLTLVGSIDDQLVSLESSIFSPVTHPHIYRAVSIDSRIHAPDFLSHLVGFVLKLRNLGVQDHGLIRELSSPLAGSLYSGEGHSRIYDDDAVYDLAVSFALETSTLTNIPLSRRTISASSGNPYVLPFAMRGVLEEDFVRTELQEEAQQLLREFDDWKPNTKSLKDVKFRLEGVRSKL